MIWDEPLRAGTRVVIRTRPQSGRGEVVMDVDKLQPLSPVRLLLDDGRKEWCSGMDLLLDERA